MKDLYDALGVDKNASFKEIKVAYRKLATKAHPDKGGSDEQMKLLNEAYATLSDPEKKKEFDNKWADYQAVDDVTFIPAGYFDIHDSVRFCESYKIMYQSKIHYFYTNRKNIANLGYHITYGDVEPLYFLNTEDFDDIFSYIRAKTERYEKCTKPILENPLTVERAINIFSQFLAGDYFGQAIMDIVDYFNENLTTMDNDIGVSKEKNYNKVF